MKLIHFPDAPNQKLGVQNDRLDKVFKTEPDKTNIFFIFMPGFWQNISIDFFQFFNFAHFRRRFTTLKQSLQKKSHIPRRSPRKDEDFVHLTFLIFKLLSHNFLNDRWGDFQFS